MLDSGNKYIIEERMLNEAGLYDLIYKVTTSNAVKRKDSVRTVEDDLVFLNKYGIYDGSTNEAVEMAGGLGIPLYAALENMDSAKFQTIFVDNLVADNVFADYLESKIITVSNANLDYATITSTVAKSISVADLKAGDITVSDLVKIKSENGNLLINGSTMQFLDSDGNVGIQIGYGEVKDSSGNVVQEYSRPSITISDNNGNTILNSSGITSYAISDGLIVNSMVGDGQISEDKLSFDVITDGNGKILIESIYDRDGKQFGDVITEFVSNTNTSIENLESRIEESSVYVLYINMPSGSNITPNGVQMDAILYRNSEEVTDEFPASCFTWKRYSEDEAGDVVWNNKGVIGKSITVYDFDVVNNARFECIFNDQADPGHDTDVFILNTSRLNYAILG